MAIAADSKIVTVMGPRKPQVQIRVVTPGGAPVGGVKVEVGSVIWELTPLRWGLFSKETDSNGLVNLDGMLPGGYLVHAFSEDLEVQATPAQVNIDLFGKATPDSLTLILHGAPWYYTLTVTYPSAVGSTAAQIFGGMLELERQFMGARFDEVRVVGASVEIDFHIEIASPVVWTPLIIVAMFTGLGILIILGIVGWILKERFIPPAQKKPGDFIAPDGQTFTDQAALAQYLIGKNDPHPWQCAYEGCNLRFATEAEKLAHMETFHKVEKIPLIEIAGIVVLGLVLYGIVSSAMGRPVILPVTGAGNYRAQEEARRHECASPGCREPVTAYCYENIESDKKTYFCKQHASWITAHNLVAFDVETNEAI